MFCFFFILLHWHGPYHSLPIFDLPPSYFSCYSTQARIMTTPTRIPRKFDKISARFDTQYPLFDFLFCCGGCLVFTGIADRSSFPFSSPIPEESVKFRWKTRELERSSISVEGKEQLDFGKTNGGGVRLGKGKKGKHFFLLSFAFCFDLLALLFPFFCHHSESDIPPRLSRSNTFAFVALLLFSCLVSSSLISICYVYLHSWFFFPTLGAVRTSSHITSRCNSSF